MSFKVLLEFDHATTVFVHVVWVEHGNNDKRMTVVDRPVDLFRMRDQCIVVRLSSEQIHEALLHELPALRVGPCRKLERLLIVLNVLHRFFTCRIRKTLCQFVPGYWRFVVMSYMKRRQGRRTYFKRIPVIVSRINPVRRDEIPRRNRFPASKFLPEPLIVKVIHCVEFPERFIRLPSHSERMSAMSVLKLSGNVGIHYRIAYRLVCRCRIHL